MTRIDEGNNVHRQEDPRKFKKSFQNEVRFDELFRVNESRVSILLANFHYRHFVQC